MELGIIPNLENFNFNSQEKVQVVSETHKLQNVKEEKETKEILVSETLDVEESYAINETKLQNSSSYQEVVLTNLNFGFNSSSRDFFVKSVHGETENQYPTDDMMRLKAYLLAQN